ncbi:MAG TPA: hypothetical protein PKI46_06195 [Bacteroidales bacterium]|nr:hypothetical protein [Bacteroidales bacterium]
MEIVLEGKKVIKALIDQKLLIPKNDKDALYVPVEVTLSITGNVLRIVPSHDAVTFNFDKEFKDENKPIYDKSLINKDSVDKFARLKIEEKSKEIPDCTNSKSEVKRIEIQKQIPKKKSIF